MGWGNESPKLIEMKRHRVEVQRLTAERDAALAKVEQLQAEVLLGENLYFRRTDELADQIGTAWRDAFTEALAAVERIGADDLAEGVPTEGSLIDAARRALTALRDREAAE